MTPPPPPPLTAHSATFCYAFLYDITISEQYFLLYVCISYFLLGARKNKYVVLAEGLGPLRPHLSVSGHIHFIQVFYTCINIHMFLKLERPEMGDLAKENFGCKRKMSIFSSILNPSSLLQHLRRSIHIC